MIKIVARMPVKAGETAKFKEMAKELVLKSRAEEGNVSYSLNENAADSGALTFIEIWKDQAAIDIHNATEHFTTILPKLAALCDGAPEIDTYTEIDI